MTLPARFIAGHLVWSWAGDVWAVYSVAAPSYRRLPRREKLTWHTRTAAALMSLPGESMILGVAAPVDRSSVVARMVDGVDVNAHPGWGQIARDTFDKLAGARLYSRRHYIAVALPDTAKSRRAQITGSAAARVGQRFRIPPRPVSVAACQEAQRAADKIGGVLGQHLGAARVAEVTTAELHWLYARSGLRGVAEPSLEEFLAPTLREFGEGDDRRLRGPALTSLANFTLLEGGDEDDANRPRHHRYVRVTGQRSVGYQSFAVVSDMPASWVYPGGGEVLSHLDSLEFPVDWCVRNTPMGNAEAQKKVQSKIRDLNGQWEEYQGDTAGPPPALSENVAHLQAEWEALASTPGAPEIRSTLIMAVGAPDLVVLEQRMEKLGTALAVNEFMLPRPHGDQDGLYDAMLPGAASTGVVGDYPMFLLPAGLAGCAPFAGSQLGDERGALLGINLDATRGGPVLFAASNGPQLTKEQGGPKSGSFAIFGALGGGKSYTLKRIVADTLLRGGQVVVTDRTPMGEYKRLAGLVEGRSRVVPITADSTVSLDPMAVFTKAEDRARYTKGFLTLLTGIAPSGLEGVALSEAVDRAVERSGRMAEVIAELSAAGEGGDPDAAKMERRLRGWARGTGLARVVFGGGERVRLDDDYIVFHTPNLSLPSRDVLANPTLARQLLPEQVFSQALLYLITAVARSIAFSDPTRFSLVVQDEGYVLTSTPQGQELLTAIVRDGRKHAAALGFASHHPDDLGDPHLAELMGSVFLFRMGRSAAPAGLALLGLEASEANVGVLDEANRSTGQCLYRDLAGNIGLMQVLEAQTPELREAFRTDAGAVAPTTATRTGNRRPRVVQR